MKSVRFNPLASLVMAAALTVGLTACGGSSTTPEPATPEPVQPPPPTDQETTADAAATAAMAAKVAYDDAKESSANAMAAIAGLATLQTGEMAADYAMKAKAAADKAMAESEKAKMASDAAAAATLASAAGVERGKAEAARMAAEDAKDMAVAYAMKAMDAAMMELKIVGTMKSVGDTTIDAGAPKTEVTRGSGDSAEKTITGLVSSVTTTGGATEPQAGIAAVLATGTKYQALRVGAAERSGEKNALGIGKHVDSADDMSRLTIVTAYAGMQTANVYTSTDDIGHRSNSAGTIVTDSSGGAIADTGDFTVDTHVENRLVPVGMFYRAGAAGAAFGTPTSVPDAALNVAADAKMEQVYSFVNKGATGAPTVYVVLDEIQTTEDSAGETHIYRYRIVDIHVALDADGLASTPPDPDGTPETTTVAEDVFVTADVPAPVDYQHLHFGVWASLGEASKDGSQDITGLGIGFVQSIGDGMTADMPITGEATYNGNWVATVESSVGDSALEDGTAEVVADFDESEITATLNGLATLEGTITGSSFSGEKATVGANTLGLTGSSFDGSFSGGFYGAKAVEAAGVFDYSSSSGGAFTGAFGGMTKDTTD